MGENRQIDAYKDQRSLKHHEREMLDVMESRLGADFGGRLLDIGCASGNLLAGIAERFRSAQLAGFDLDEGLVSLARERLGERAQLWVDDAVGHEPSSEGYDALVASGVLSIFEDPFAVLSRWVGWLKPGGFLFVFGRFNSRPIDTQILFRNRYNSDDWEGGLSSYSTQTIGEHLDTLGCRWGFKRFYLPMDLEEQEDPIRTWTLQLETGERVVVNGANVIAEHHFLTVGAPDA